MASESIIFLKEFIKLSVQTVARAVLNTQTLKMVLIEFKCLCCNKNYRKMFDENLKKKFANTYKICVFKWTGILFEINFIILSWILLAYSVIINIVFYINLLHF